jgi:N-acylneuraminate cytidylyltransferase
VNLAIIPARGGSKRIPKKNIKLFHGKPIIAYSIEAALSSNCFDEVIVSTDCEEIADIAKKFGAQVPFVRPAAFSDDYATTTDVIKHAIKWYENNNLIINNICCIYATAPFVSRTDISTGLETLINGNYDYAFSVTSYEFPIQRALKIDGNGRSSMFYPEHLNTRSQDLIESFHDAGQFYWGTSEAFSLEKPIFTSNSFGIKLPRIQVQDIDTYEDWERAEIMYSLLDK